MDCDEVLANSSSFFDIFFFAFFSEDVPCASSDECFLFVLSFLVTVSVAGGVLLPKERPADYSCSVAQLLTINSKLKFLP